MEGLGEEKEGWEGTGDEKEVRRVELPSGITL